MRNSSPPAKREKPRVGLYDTVVALAQVVPVDYSVPDCPPPGSVLGVRERTWCGECPSSRRERRPRHCYHRPWEDLGRPEEREWVPR